MKAATRWATVQTPWISLQARVGRSATGTVETSVCSPLTAIPFASGMKLDDGFGAGGGGGAALRTARRPSGPVWAAHAHPAARDFSLEGPVDPGQEQQE